MKEQTIYAYRAQLARNEPLSMDQQRALIAHAAEVLGKPGDEGKSVEMLRQKVAEQANGMKQALADLQAAFATGRVHKATYIATCMDQYLHQKITTKDFNRWADWQVTINEEFGDE